MTRDTYAVYTEQIISASPVPRNRSVLFFSDSFGEIDSNESKEIETGEIGAYVKKKAKLSNERLTIKMSPVSYKGRYTNQCYFSPVKVEPAFGINVDMIAYSTSADESQKDFSILNSDQLQFAQLDA
jgi:hypothetical protein